MKYALLTLALLGSMLTVQAAPAAGEVAVYTAGRQLQPTNALSVASTTNVAVKGLLRPHGIGPVTNLTASLPVVTDGSKNLTSGTVSGTGAFALVDSPTFTTTVTLPIVDSTDSTSFPLIVDSATGGLAPKTDGALLYNASSGALTATSFVGSGAGLTYTGSGNNGNLATSVDTLQELNDAVDNLSLGGSGANWTASGTTNSTLAGDAYVHSITATNSVIAGTGNGTLQLGQTANQKFTISGNGDGTATFTGDGAANDEDFKIDPVGTANTAVFTSSTGMATWDFGTSWVFKLGTIELGHATANTLSASSGQLSVEGNAVFTAAITKADVLEAALFASDAGANDTYTATLSPAITAYVTGAHYRFKANTANTGAATINLNGLGAKTIKKAAGGITSDLADNDIRAGQWVDMVYDGTNMQMQSTLGNAAAGSGTVTSVGWTGGIVSIATATTTPAFTIAGTSGGIPYFSGSTTWASSAALAANAIVLGGGAGAAPATTTTGSGVVTAIGNAVNTSGGLITDGGTPAVGITLGENASIKLDPAGSADGKWSGMAVQGTSGYTQAFGDLVYLDPTDSRWEACDANSASGADGDSRGMIGMVVSTGTDGNACTILLSGIVRADAKFATFTVNNPIYVSETAGAITQTQPTTTDVVIRIIGAALTADEIYFRPDWTWITHN